MTGVEKHSAVCLKLAPSGECSDARGLVNLAEAVGAEEAAQRVMSLSGRAMPLSILPLNGEGLGHVTDYAALHHSLPRSYFLLIMLAENDAAALPVDDVAVAAAAQGSAPYPHLKDPYCFSVFGHTHVRCPTVCMDFVMSMSNNCNCNHRNCQL